MKHHDIRDGDPLPTRATPPPLALIERDAELARVRTATAVPGPRPMREIAIEGVMHLEGCDRAAAIAIVDAPRAPREIESADARKERERLETRKRVRTWLTEKSGIPLRPEMVDPVLDGKAERTPTVRAASKWLAEPYRRVLVLLGPRGLGKTVAAGLVAVAYSKRQRAVRYIREPLLVRWMGSATLVHEAKVEQLLEADLLIVDEVGTTAAALGERARDTMFTTLDERIRGDVRTIFNGNVVDWRCLDCGRAHPIKVERCAACGSDADRVVEHGSAEALGRAYGARFVDRLREVGVIVELHGESMRGRS